MTGVIDQLYEALFDAVTELYMLHHRHKMPHDSKATLKAEKVGKRFQTEIMRRRYTRASKRK